MDSPLHSFSLVAAKEELPYESIGKKCKLPDGLGPTALALLESSRHTDVDERKQRWMLTNLRVGT